LENYKETNSYSKSDIVGIISSSICVVHCILTPFIVVILPNCIKENYEDINYLFLVLGFISMLLSVKSTKLNLVKYLLIYFWLQLCLSIFLEERSVFFSLLMYFSAFGLIIGHILNMKYCKNCQHNND
jgi:hypothetical protein